MRRRDRVASGIGHEVRGDLSGLLRKRLGLTVTPARKADQPASAFAWCSPWGHDT